MRISEAAQQSGVTVSTFKYYVREGLVHEGTRLSGNQTAYETSHVQRVRLVRALLETGGLSIGAAKAVIATLDSNSNSDSDDSLAYTFAAAQHALGALNPTLERPSAQSRRAVEDVATAQGWHTTAGNPGFEAAARVLDGFAAIGFRPSPEYLNAYASAAASIARADLAALQTRDRPDLIAELMVVGTVLGDALAAGLRRLAHESVTAELFPAPGTRKETESPEHEHENRKS